MLDCAVTIQGFLYLGSCPVASCVSWATGRCLLWDLVWAGGADLSRLILCSGLATFGLLPLLLLVFHTPFVMSPPIVHVIMFVFSSPPVTFLFVSSYPVTFLFVVPILLPSEALFSGTCRGPAVSHYQASFWSSSSSAGSRVCGFYSILAA